MVLGTVHRRGVARERRRRRRRRERERRESNRRPRRHRRRSLLRLPAQRPYHRRVVASPRAGEEGTRGEPLPPTARRERLGRPAHPESRRRPRSTRAQVRVRGDRGLAARGVRGAGQGRERREGGGSRLGRVARRVSPRIARARFLRGGHGRDDPVRAGGQGRRDPVRGARRRRRPPRGGAGGREGNEGDEGTERRVTGFARRRRRTAPDDFGRALGARRSRRGRRAIAADVAGAPDAPKDQRDAPAPAPRAPGLAPEGVREGLVRVGKGRRRPVAMLPVQQQLRHRGVHARLRERRLVLRVHRPPPRRGVRAPNDDDDRYKSRYEDVRRPERGEKSVVVEAGHGTGRVGVGARRASGRDRERRDRPAGGDNNEPAASQERAGADAPAVAPLLHDAPEERRGGETRRAQAALGRRAGVCRSHGHPTRVEPGGNDRDAAKDFARSAGDDAAGGQASARGRDTLGRVALSR